MSIFKAWDQEIEINGRTITARLTIRVDEDYDTNIEDDISFDNKDAEQEYINRFKSGELFIAKILVIATALTDYGTDSLGACHIHSNNAFNPKPFEDDVNQIIEDHGMVASAIDDLTNNLKSTLETLKAALE